MTDIPAQARKCAVNFEARKIAYRQSKEGMVLSLVIHPNEMPDAVATAGLGQRYVVALVALSDDDTPLSPAKGGANQKAQAQAQNSDPTHIAPRSPATEGGARKRDWNELSPAQQTGMLCHDPTFVRFLIEEIEHDFSVTCPEDAATIVRQQCGVKTRADIVPGTDAATKWSRLYGRFLAWKIAA